MSNIVPLGKCWGDIANPSFEDNDRRAMAAKLIKNESGRALLKAYMQAGMLPGHALTHLISLTDRRIGPDKGIVNIAALSFNL